MIYDRDDEMNLEAASPEPKLELMMSELETARQEINTYLDRNNQAYDYWQSRWPGQTISGLKEGPDAFPWKNSSDARVRTVKQVVRDHVAFGMSAIRNARVQARSVRPFAQGQGRETNQISKLLQWEVGTHMRANIQREARLALAWRFAYGAAVVCPEWETDRRLEMAELTVPGLTEWIAIQEQVPEEAMGRLTAEILAALFDPAQEDTLAAYVKAIPMVELTSAGARKVITRLRQESHAQLPIAYVFRSLPVWTSRRIGVDIIFPAEADDLQKQRFIALLEPVTETTLRDRIETEEYDAEFVEEALKHKGAGFESTWVQRTAADRGLHSSAFEKMVQLVHFDARVSHNGVPCMYRTTFCPAVLRMRRTDRPLYAKHGPRGYKHGLFPCVEMRHETEHRPIITSVGIPEIAYTWEQTLKAHLDGTVNRAQIVLRPPMIVPYNRVAAIKQEYGPGALMGSQAAGREVQFAPLPPFDATPAAIMEYVDQRVERFFPLFGVDLDPDLKRVYREDLAASLLGELDNCYDQTFRLMQEFLPDAQAMRVVGPLSRPFQVSREEIQGQFTVEATFDPRSVEEDYLDKKIDQLAKAAQLAGQSGAFNFTGIARNLAESIDPDASDELVDDAQTSAQRETDDEKNAFRDMMVGMEPDFPQFGNHQLRLQVINQQLQSPTVRQRIAQNPDVMELIQNRIKLHQNQIQQYQQNPQIGRAVGTQTFEKVAPQLSMGS